MSIWIGCSTASSIPSGRAAGPTQSGHRPSPADYLYLRTANNPEDLATVAQWLDTYPNMYADIDARISELGRQPYTARKFFLKYQDRIMFGTDTARSGCLPHVLPVPGNRRRVLRLCLGTSPPRFLDDLWRVPTR